MTSHASIAAPILAALAILATLMGGYVWAYLGLQTESYQSTVIERCTTRKYASDWVGWLFVPAAKTEALLVNGDVFVVGPSGLRVVC